MRSSSSFVAALAATALWAIAANANPLCTSPMEPSKGLLAKIDAAERSWTGSADAKAPLKSLLVSKAAVRWTCKNDANEQVCCRDIPLELVPVESSKTQCKVLVGFPYGELRIKRNNGSFKPRISWRLDPAMSPPAHMFGSAGILITPIGADPLPVDGDGMERCNYNHKVDTFRCKSNGKKTKAEHVANVYPNNQVDQLEFRCENIDPPILNADN